MSSEADKPEEQLIDIRGIKDEEEDEKGEGDVPEPEEGNANDGAEDAGAKSFPQRVSLDRLSNRLLPCRKTLLCVRYTRERNVSRSSSLLPSSDKALRYSVK